MFTKFTIVARAAFAIALGAALMGPVAGTAHAQPASSPSGYQVVGLDFDAEIGECVRLGGTADDATIERASCGSRESNYTVIGKASTGEGCIADRDNWYAETIDDVPVGALCLDIDWVIGGCMDVAGDDPQRIDCTEPAVDGVRVVDIAYGADDVSACASSFGYEYTVRHFVVCVEEF